MKKKIFYYSLASLSALAPLVAAPVVSCTKTDPLDKNIRGKQNTILKSQATKNNILEQVSNGWIMSLYSSELKNIDSKVKDKLAKLFENKNSAYYKDFKTFFDIYTERSLKNNPQHFKILKQELLTNGVNVLEFNPVMNQKMTDDDMEFLYKNSSKLSNGVRTQIHKMMTVYNYLTKSRNEAMNFTINQATKNDISLEKIDTKDYSEYDKERFELLDLASADVFLVKYLLDNKLVESWSFKRKENAQLWQNHAEINSIEQYNELIKNNEIKYTTAKNESLKIGLKNNELDDLRGYNGIVKFTGTAADKLSYSNYWIKNNKHLVHGFIDPNSSNIYSMNNLHFNQIVIDSIQTKPEFKLKDSSKDKKDGFTKEDFEVTGWDYDSTKKEFTKKYSEKTFKLIIDRVEKINFENKNKELETNITLTIKLSAPELGEDSTFVYTDELFDKKATTQTEFEQEKFPSTVNLFVKSSNELKGEYLIKIVPVTKKITVKENNKDVSKNKATLENTLWGETKNKDLLVKNIINNDLDNLYKQASKYYSKLGFGIQKDSIDKTIIDFLKVENLID
ncbi:HinT-interacting membrane complex lipoprotein P60 [Mycoplasma phocoenae]|uniref:Lipoprotein n=1 Tax=Mycoplasma phocoenae TaxID=754517 RepID=A0A858U6V7_9MOLU|nr:hypothetical protein [Mycoplasma phocoenae]QJG66963.1 hypothetical protein HGG69_01330 [Mycoplasma phocoenae]